jgi:hypothetical protein
LVHKIAFEGMKPCKSLPTIPGRKLSDHKPDFVDLAPEADKISILPDEPESKSLPIPPSKQRQRPSEESSPTVTEQQQQQTASQPSVVIDPPPLPSGSVSATECETEAWDEEEEEAKTLLSTRDIEAQSAVKRLLQMALTPPSSPKREMKLRKEEELGREGESGSEAVAVEKKQTAEDSSFPSLLDVMVEQTEQSLGHAFSSPVSKAPKPLPHLSRDSLPRPTYAAPVWRFRFIC